MMENKFQCPRCRKQFISESSRDIHVEIYHMSKKDSHKILCQYCNKPFLPLTLEVHAKKCAEVNDRERNARKRLGSDKEKFHYANVKKDRIEFADNDGTLLREEQVIDDISICGLEDKDLFEEVEVHNDVNVFMYKKQGVFDERYERMKNVDFSLGFSTLHQFKLFEQFGNQIVCLDSMHLASKPDILLTTLLVIDNNGVGLPVSWLLCNRVKAVTLMTFLEKFKEAYESCCGKFPYSDYIMSDDADNYYKLWRKVMGCSPKKLISASHVDNAWSIKLDSLVKDPRKQSKIHTSLRGIMAIDNPDVAYEHAIEFCNELLESTDTSYFGMYFKHQWLNRIKAWTASYETGAEINSNIFIDAFHRLLERKYLISRTDIGLSHCVDALLRYERDEFLDTDEGKVTQNLLRTELIIQRHKVGVSMGSNNVIKRSSELYEVRSSTYNDSFYEVKFDGECDSEECLFKCSSCQICPHAVRCSCLDALNKNVICKHVHAVCSAFNGRNSPIEWDCQIIGPIPMIPYKKTIENLKELAAKCYRITEVTPQHLLNKLDKSINEISVILNSLSEPDKSNTTEND